MTHWSGNSLPCSTPTTFCDCPSRISTLLSSVISTEGPLSFLRSACAEAMLIATAGSCSCPQRLS